MKKRKRMMVQAAAVLVIAAAVGGVIIHNARTLVKGEKDRYTYKITGQAPENWSPLCWETAGEQEILSWTTTPLYAFASDEEEGIVMLPELAAAEPEDVTAEYAGNETYGISKKAEEGYAWRITLREDAVWEDGSAVTAADFERTLQYYLGSGSGHESDFTLGTVVIANAAAYQNGGITAAYDDGYADVADEDLMFGLTEPTVFCVNRSLEEYYEYRSADLPEVFLDSEGKNLYEQLEELAGKEGYVPLTEEIKALLVQFCSNCGKKDEQAYRKLCVYRSEENAPAWETVGIETDGDYTVTLILSSPVTGQELAYGLSELYLINADLYENDADAYGTGKDAYLSYGPYKIVSYDADTGMKLERNENWFGYQDPDYDGQYQTTDIQITYGLSHEEQWDLWTQGNLSVLELAGEDRDKCGDSELVYSGNENWTYVYWINSDLVSLKKEEADGENHSILYYKDFRHAISLALDRADYAKSHTFASAPGFGLFGYGFTSDAETGETYRDTETAIAALCSAYGVKEESELSGYDAEKAAAYLRNAYEACLEDGNIRDTDQVVLRFYGEDPENDAETEIAFLQNALDQAAAGTGLEGRIRVEEAADAESADICGSILRGEAWNPYRALRYLCDPGSQKVKGYYEDTYKISVTLSGDKISKTPRGWYEELCAGTYRSADSGTKGTILSAMEKQILNTYSVIPLYYEKECRLYSSRLTPGNGTESPAGDGTVWFLSYSMDDAEWAKYCKEQDYALGY